MGKTFRESLLWAAFEDDWPLWSSAKEREHYWANTPEIEPYMLRARELGKAYRNGEWSPEFEAEFNALVGLDDSFARHTLKQAAREQGAVWMG